MANVLKMVAPIEIGVCVRDLDAMVAFYEQVVGLTRSSTVELDAETAQRAGFNDSGFRMTRMQTPYGERIKLLEPRKPAQQRDNSAAMSTYGPAYLTFLVEDLKATLVTLASAGAELVSGPDPIQTRPGTLIAFARDPEGNSLEFVEYADLQTYRPDLF